MESKDHDLIIKFVDADLRVKRLYQQYLKLEELHDDINKRKMRTEDSAILLDWLNKEEVNSWQEMLAIVKSLESENRAS